MGRYRSFIERYYRGRGQKEFEKRSLIDPEIISFFTVVVAAVAVIVEVSPGV